MAKIEALGIELAGWILGLAISVSFLNQRYQGLAVEALLLLYFLTRFKPEYFYWVRRFAKPTTWPPYVAFGFVVCIAAYHGGLAGLALAVSMLIMDVGRIFDVLYVS